MSAHFGFGRSLDKTDHLMTEKNKNNKDCQNNILKAS